MTRSQQRALFGLLLIIAGIVVAIIGYVGVSGETTVAFQLPYFASAGVAALMLLGGGGVMLVLAQIERDGERFDQLEDATRQLAREVGRLLDQLEDGRPVGSNGGPPTEELAVLAAGLGSATSARTRFGGRR
jgi:hypothetical protein